MNIISNTPEKLVLRIAANETLANAIRRSVSEIATLAIDEVEIFKNDSALYDEVLAHRIGLIPLVTEKSMNSKTKIDLKLSKVGPATVYSGDFEGDAKIVFAKIPLTILGEGQKIELIGTASLGKGIDHAKYTPGLFYYRHLLEIKSSPENDKLIQSSSLLIKPEKKGSKWVCDINDAALKEITDKDEEAVSDSDEMLLIIESYGNMPAKEILTKAIAALEDNLDEVEKALK